MALLYISCILKWTGTYHRVHGATSTASLHISCVLKWSGIDSKERGSICTTSLHISWVHGMYFDMSNKIYRNGFFNKQLIIFFITLGPGEILHFYNPHSQVYHQNLRCWLYVQQLKQAQDKGQSRPAIWSLMIGSFSISWRNFLTSVILSHWGMPVEYKWITCLPKVFPVFSPFSFSSRCFYSAYVLLTLSALALPTF